MPTVGSHAAALPALASVAGTSLPSSAKVAAARGGEVQIMLTYSADSWTEVYDATGRRLLYGMASGPATRKLHGPPPLDVMLGDARSITLEVGGRAESISPFVRPDHTARFLIGADGRLRTASRKKGG
jgi:cytoskeleton protein RodZ